MNQLHKDRLTAVLVGAASIASLVIVGAVVLPSLAAATLAAEPGAADALHLTPAPPGKALDLHLATFDGTSYAIGTESGVTLTPTSVSLVRKIGYGDTNFVAIGTTPSGVYSSDGITSVHVAYPGVEVTPLRIAAATDDGVLGWSGVTGWTKIPVLNAQSISFLDAIETDAGRGSGCAAAATGGRCP